MRLAHFRLERYGPFEQRDLRFDPTPGRVNLIVAPNGYGKSVIRRAIGEFLFGIEARTPMTFRFGTERMHLRAEIVYDGTSRSFVRRKGNGNTLSHADGTEVPKAEADRILGGANPTVFRELFGLDTTLLRSGGQDLIRSQGRLGQVLFAAGGGMGRVRDLLTDLERQRDDLGRASVRHRSRPIWNALSNWEQARADLRSAALRPDGWTAFERQAADTAQALDSLLAEQAQESQERERLRTLSACRPWLARLATAKQTLVESADAPELDETFEKRWRDALEDAVKSTSAATAARHERQSAQETRETLNFNPAWIAAASDIDRLTSLRVEALGAERDLPNVERDLAADRFKAADLRRDLGWSATFALPPTHIVKDAQRRLQQHPKLALDAASARDRLAEAERQLAATLAELEHLPAPSAITAVTDLAATIRAAGDPATRLDASRRKLREAEAALRAALGAIPDSPLAEAALGTTAAPSEAKLEAAGKALSDAEAAHTRALRDHADRQRTIDTERTKLAALERSAMLPPPDALTTARARRDAIWAQLCIPEARPDPSTALALDRAIRDADAVADALIAHGREAAAAAALRDRLATLDAAHTTEPITQAAAQLAQAQAALLTIAQAAGGNASDVSALRTFLKARDAALTCRNTRDAAAADLTALEQDLTTQAAKLAESMGTTPPELTTLTTLLTEADRRIDADRTLTAHRKTLTDQAAKHRTARDAAATAAAKADQALAQWTAQWRPVAATLVRPETETIATTADALTQIENLRATETNAAKDQTRVDDMRAAIAAVATNVAHLAALSPELAELPPFEAAEAFRLQLQHERQQAARCADADRRIEHAAQKHAAAQAAAETAARTLAGLRAALRADTDEAAERQLQRARAATAARLDQAEALRHLADLGGGLSFETLTARAAETTAEADTARIAAIDAAHQSRLPLIEAARTARTEAAAALDHASTDHLAADAAQRREDAQAAIARTTEEALILHATHALLQAALDRQAATADQPLLARIGAIFRTITGGAQAGVRIEDTNHGQTMVALEADGTTRKPLDQLSEGTCDQLYLALRIAALEDFAAATPPLPFIADDILQTFDDPRTEATMQALLALSEKVQVIVLTHHAHVGTLAERFPGQAVHVLYLTN